MQFLLPFGASTRDMNSGRISANHGKWAVLCMHFLCKRIRASGKVSCCSSSTVVISVKNVTHSLKTSSRVGRGGYRVPPRKYAFNWYNKIGKNTSKTDCYANKSAKCPMCRFLRKLVPPLLKNIFHVISANIAHNCTNKVFAATFSGPTIND